MIGESYGGANYDIYIVSLGTTHYINKYLDYIVHVENNSTSNGITYISTVPIPQDDIFPVDTVVGTAYSPNPVFYFPSSQ